MFGLPDGVTACLLDMDGVVTQTAVVHAAAWQETFDEFLRKYAESTGTEFVPFDPHAEYDAYVDGKPRLDGTRAFLASRGIELPEGTPDDPPGTPTIYGLSNQPGGCIGAEREENGLMSAEDLEKYEAEMELQLYREYRDVVGLFTHVVETERRFYLTNDVELNVRSSDNGEVFFEVTMRDAWVWDMYRPARFVKNVRVVTFKDVNIEELAKADLEVLQDKPDFPA